MATETTDAKSWPIIPNHSLNPDILAVPADAELPGGAPAGAQPAAKPDEPPKPQG